MEAIIQNIPAVISIILPVALALMIVTNIIVEVVKGLTWGKLPTNVLAFFVAMAVTLLAFFAMCQIAGVQVTWYMVVGAIVLGFFVCFAAMYGFDKLKQTMEQFNSIRQNK
jgi:Na+/glutamate symporter